MDTAINSIKSENHTCDGQIPILHSAVHRVLLCEVTVNVLLWVFLLLLLGHSPLSMCWSVRQKKGQDLGEVKENWLNVHKGLLALLQTLNLVPLFSEISHWACEVQIIQQKPVIISCQCQEMSHFLFGPGSWTGNTLINRHSFSLWDS